MSFNSNNQPKVRTVIKCPTCQESTWWQGNPYRPFCSSRCRLLDLGCWADEEYRVPAGDFTGLDEALDSVE
ncbi:MAG: DNA gyrase inhibitor YacG [Syntrophotaleaceae bacterium]